MNNFNKKWKKAVLTLAIMLMTTAGAWAQIEWNGTQTFVFNTIITENIVLTGGTTVNVGSGITVLITGNINGGIHTLTKTGGGAMTITGNCGISGGTTISDGVLQIGNGGTTGQWSGNIVNNGSLKFNRSSLYVHAGNISGSGSLTKNGAHLTLTGNLTYTGTTFVENGNLQIGNGTNGGGLNSNVNLSNSSIVLRFEPSTNITYSKVISGQGKVEYKGSSSKILSLTGNNSHTGTTTVEAGGVLIIGDYPSSTTGSIAGDIILNTGAKLDFRRSNNYIYSGAILGSGSVQKFLSSKVTLTGANNYTGSTTVDAGTLQIGNGTTTNTNINSTSGITINSGATLRFELATNMAISKIISGAGKVEFTSDYKTLYLTANNTYTGTTTIEKGHLYIGDNGTTGDIKGNIIINDAGSRLIFRRSNAYTYSGVISGVGEVCKYNSNTVTLNGNNTYTGTTTIYEGTLVLGTNGRIENSKEVILGADNNSKFDVSAGNKKIRAIRSMYEKHELVLGSTTLTIGTAGQEDEVSRLYGKITGTGGITKQGTGIVFMNSSHTATGTFTHSQGTVSIEGSNTKWDGNYNLQSNGILSFLKDTSQFTIGGNFTLTGGKIEMSLNATPPNKIKVTGSVSASENNKLIINNTTNAITAHPIIEAASGINSTTPYTVEKSLPYTHLSATGTQLLLYASTTPLLLPVITTATLPDGFLETAYTANIIADGLAPITLSLEDGNLPPGLTLADDGKISGTPTTEGTFKFMVKATNPLGYTMRELSIKIEGDVNIVETRLIASVQAYPNPTRGEFWVSGFEVTSYELQVTSYEIFDVMGRKLLTSPLSLTSPETTLNLAHLPNGIYFLKITTENGVITKKIIKNE